MKNRMLATLEVPAIGMGSANTFNVEDEEGLEVRRQIIDNCIESGSTFIDTSPMYGRAEQALGISMEGKAPQFQFATKVWAVGRETGQRQILRSFELLKTDHIEVFQIHNMVDWKTHLPYLEGLRDGGKIDLIGVTYTYPPGFPEMMEIMKTGRIQAIQISYNALETGGGGRDAASGRGVGNRSDCDAAFGVGRAGEGTEGAAGSISAGGIRYYYLAAGAVGMGVGRPPHRDTDTFEYAPRTNTAECGGGDASDAAAGVAGARG